MSRRHARSELAQPTPCRSWPPPEVRRSCPNSRSRFSPSSEPSGVHFRTNVRLGKLRPATEATLITIRIQPRAQAAHVLDALCRRPGTDQRELAAVFGVSHEQLARSREAARAQEEGRKDRGVPWGPPPRR